MRATFLAAALLGFTSSAEAAQRRLRGLQATVIPTPAPTYGCVLTGAACSTGNNALSTCCNGLTCVTATNTTTVGLCQAPTAAPTPVPTPKPTCHCANETSVCIDGVNGEFTCCNGLYCSAYPGSGANGTCIRPTPPPTPAPVFWPIPGTIQAGLYNSNVDIADPNNLGGPRVGNGTVLGYIRADEVSRT